MEEPTIQEKVDYLNHILSRIHTWDVKENQSAHVGKIKSIYDELCAMPALPEDDASVYVDEIKMKIRRLHNDMDKALAEVNKRGVSEIDSLLQNLKW